MTGKGILKTLLREYNGRITLINIDIVCGEFGLINGANRVTEKLIYGYEIFKENGIILNNLFTSNNIYDCSIYKSVLGNHSINYSRKRKLVTSLKNTFLYRSFIAQSIMQCRAISVSKKSVITYLGKNIISDCIIFQDVFSAYYYLKMKKPNDSKKTLVITHADTDPMEQMLINRPELKGTITEKVIRNKYNYVIENVDKVVTICHSSQKYIKDNNGIDAACILNGIEDLQKGISENNEKVPENKINIVVLGSVIYRKGQDLIIEAVSKLSYVDREKIMIHIIGTGSAFVEIQNRIQEYKLNSCFKMYGEMKDVNAILSKMDVMLLPSRAEAVPIAIIEGLRAGLPVFSTHVGEVPFMIDDCGVIIDPTVESVFSALRLIIDKNIDLEKLSIKARLKYEKVFTLNKMINNYSNQIKEICSFENDLSD